MRRGKKRASWPKPSFARLAAGSIRVDASASRIGSSCSSSITRLKRSPGSIPPSPTQSSPPAASTPRRSCTRELTRRSETQRRRAKNTSPRVQHSKPSWRKTPAAVLSACCSPAPTRGLDARRMRCAKPGAPSKRSQSPRMPFLDRTSKSIAPRSRAAWAKRMQRSITFDSCSPSRACSPRHCCASIPAGPRFVVIRDSGSWRSSIRSSLATIEVGGRGAPVRLTLASLLPLKCAHESFDLCGDPLGTVERKEVTAREDLQFRVEQIRQWPRHAVEGEKSVAPAPQNQRRRVTAAKLLENLDRRARVHAIGSADDANPGDGSFIRGDHFPKQLLGLGPLRPRADPANKQLRQSRRRRKLPAANTLDLLHRPLISIDAVDQDQAANPLRSVSRHELSDGGANIVRDQNRPLVEAKRIQQTKHPTRLIAHLDIQAFLCLGLTEAHQVWRNRSQSSRSEQGHYIPPKQLRGGKSVQKQNGSPAPFIPDIYVHVAERNTSHPASIRQAKDSAQTSRSVPLADRPARREFLSCRSREQFSGTRFPASRPPGPATARSSARAPQLLLLEFFIPDDRFDVVPIWIENERRVPIFFPGPGRAVVLRPGGHRRLIELVDRFLAVRMECDVAWSADLSSGDPEVVSPAVNEAEGVAVFLPDRVPQRRQCLFVELSAR